ncbi:uncharacterized protein LOC134819583 [Bolinopsis microptera]|uniref:uncharacterized protein LOC134819583 n=1 Tax=Bolinopsis microptera TaxID=2820187 RepID=UPI003078C0D7
METEKEPCPCNRCKSANSLAKKTVKNHIKLYGEFSYELGVTVGEFLSTPIESKLDEKFWTVASYILKRVQHHAVDKDVLTFKTGGKPQTYVRTQIPAKVVENPDQAVRRKLHHAHRKITSLQVNAHKDFNVDLKDIVGRLETASFQTLESKETKEYVAESSNINKRPRMDSGDTIEFMNAANITEHKMRVLRQRLKNQKFASEKSVRCFEALNEVQYEVVQVPMEFRANSNCKSDKKAGDRVLRADTPVVYTSLQSLVKTVMSKLELYQLLQPQMFTDGKIWVKVFIDADSINTKISVNVINQKLANSDYKHLLLVYSECPDKEFNIGQLMAFLNKELDVYTYKHEEHKIRLWLCGDTKQIWQILGMPVSPGIHACPFCRINTADCQIPLSRRGFRPERCYGGTKQLYALNRQKTGLNRKTQREFFNVIDEPKLNNALNNDNDAPILDWILVPIVHINLRVGQDIYKNGMRICQKVDLAVVQSMASGSSFQGITVLPDTDFSKSVEACRSGTLDPEEVTCGPYQYRYEKACSKIGCSPQAHFGGSTLNGNDAHNLVTRYHKLVPLWIEILALEIFEHDEQKLLKKEIADVISLMKIYGPLMTNLGNTNRLTKEAIDELDKEIAGFLIEYRKYFKTVPPKIHMLEDHVIPQLRKLGWSMGIGSEQGGEASHKLVKAVRQRFFNKSSDKDSILRAVTKVTSDSIIRLRSDTIAKKVKKTTSSTNPRIV